MHVKGSLFILLQYVQEILKSQLHLKIQASKCSKNLEQFFLNCGLILTHDFPIYLKKF